MSKATEIRLRRARSWLRKAGEAATRDMDAQFIFLWIAFNALYGTLPDIMTMITRRAVRVMTSRVF
jgi:hypothetical protein